MNFENLLEKMFEELEKEVEQNKTESSEYIELKNENGKLNAINKPALINKDGKFWYKDGRLHREDGPAQILSDGKEIWNLDGLLHRLDGPAKDNDFFVYGVKAKDNNDYLDLISEFKLSKIEFSNNEEQRVFLKNGIFHRDRGPAVVDQTTHYWYKNGQLHRDNMPAVLSENIILFYKEGKKHRVNGPAKIVTEYKDGKKIITETYYDYDKIHREDGPAIEIYFIDDNNRKNILSKQYFIDGKEQKSLISSSINKNTNKDNKTKQYKNEQGQLHRLDGPALENSNLSIWYKDGKLHRDGGPAIKTNKKLEWWFDGKRHRIDGPAMVSLEDNSKRWFIDGNEYHEDEFIKKIFKEELDRKSEDFDYLEDFLGDEPLSYKDEEGNIYWQKSNGDLHRLDGPAIISVDGTKSWYIDNVKYSKEEFDNKIAELSDLPTYVKPTYVKSDGTKVWKNKDGNYHRENGPAIEEPDGTKQWYLNGQRHREDGPAVEDSDGDKEWYVDGKRHRLDGPAVEDSDGSKEWYCNGQCHRLDGPAIELSNGYKEWWINDIEYSEKDFKIKVAEMNKDKPTIIDEYGNKFWKNDKKQYHREDGPAVEWTDGSKNWYIDGQLHRVDGPALEYPDNSNKSNSWYLKGKYYTENEFRKVAKDLQEELPPEIDDIRKDTNGYYDSKGRLHNWKGPAHNDDFYIFGVKIDYELFKSISYIGMNKVIWNYLKSKDPDVFIIESKHNFCFIYKNKENRYHREDGPAIIRSSGVMEWYFNSKRHREDGPAISNEGSDGELMAEYYLHGLKVSKEDFEKYNSNKNEKGVLMNVNVPGELVKRLGKDSYVKYNYIRKATAVEAISNDKIIGENFSINSCYFKFWDSVTKAEEYFYGDINVLYNQDQTIKEVSSGKAVLHKEGGPAQVIILGDIVAESWYYLGRLHRTDGPAIRKFEPSINKNQEDKVFFEEYYINGMRISTKEKYDKFYRKSNHPDDFPIKITKEDGTINYLKEGKLHNTSGPAVICPDGSFSYYYKGLVHREDGPAVFNAKEKIYEYMRYGDFHRLDGPANEYVDTPEKNDYFIEGDYMDHEEFKKFTKFHNKKIFEPTFFVPSEKVSFNPDSQKNLPVPTKSNSVSYSPSYSTTTTTKYVQEPTFVYEFVKDDKKIEIFGSAFSEIQNFSEYYEPLTEQDLIINLGYTAYEVKPFIKVQPKWLQLKSTMIVPQQLMIDLKTDGTLPNSYGKEFYKSLVISALNNNVTKILVVCDNGKAKTTVILASLIAAMESLSDNSDTDVVDIIRDLRDEYSASALDSKIKEEYVLSQYYKDDELNEAFTRLNAK